MKYIGFVAKAVLSLGLLALVLSRIELNQVVGLLLKSATLHGIFIAVGALILQGCLAAYRQVKILEILDHRIGLLPSLRVWFSGLFVTQVAVTFIAGDFVRGVQLTQTGVPRRVAGRAIVLDRVIGLAVLLLMVTAVLPYVVGLAENAQLRFSLVLLAVASAVGLLVIVGAGFLQPLLSHLRWQLVQHRLVGIAVDLASVSRFLLAVPRRSLGIAVLSLVMHLLNIFGIVVIARSLGISGPLSAVAAISIPVMLLAMLPISFAGWGVREAAMVTGMGLLHVPSELALAISVGFGLSMILASLPGLFCLLQKFTKFQAVERFSEVPRN
jgi:uncharacterized membrane protein YbhN (UPF0104 family)